LIHRRTFLAGLACLLVPLAARPQAPRRPLRLAWFSDGALGNQRPYVEAFREGMKQLGLAEGRDFSIDYFWRGMASSVPFDDLARQVVGSHPDIIVATCEVSTEAARKATSSIPIVMTASTDPVSTGTVASFSRPGGNVTGISSALLAVGAKHFEILKEIVPAASRVEVLRWKEDPVSASEREFLDRAARRSGVSLAVTEVADANDLERAFAAARKARTSGMLDTLSFTWGEVYLPKLCEAAARARMPVVHYLREAVESGGLVSFGPNLVDGFRRSARYVSRLAAGAHAGEIPVEQPDKIETCVNLRTARRIGVAIPESILLRADRVIS
jgi:putative ABC transport system substrate-binding protein